MPTWPILSALSDDEAHQLLALARRRTYRRGEVVFHRDDPSDTLHLVSSGCFAVRVSTRLGDVSTLSLVGPGQCFGELALIRPEHLRSATVQALEAGETRTLSRVEFDRQRREHPALEAFLVDLLATRVAELTERLVEALYTPAPQRVRLLIDELCERYRDASGIAGHPAHPGGPGRACRYLPTDREPGAAQPQGAGNGGGAAGPHQRPQRLCTRRRHDTGGCRRRRRRRAGLAAAAMLGNAGSRHSSWSATSGRPRAGIATTGAFACIPCGRCPACPGGRSAVVRPLGQPRRLRRVLQSATRPRRSCASSPDACPPN